MSSTLALTFEFAKCSFVGRLAFALVGAMGLVCQALSIILAFMLMARIDLVLLIILVLIKAASWGHFVPHSRRLEEV